MVCVSWVGAAAYCNWLSIRGDYEECYRNVRFEGWQCDFDKTGYRLPTEAEWEYAARGGQHDPYYTYPWGDSIDGSMANYDDSGDPFETGNSPLTTPVGYYDGDQVPAGSDMANGYGLYDMAGNVYEWCNDYYASDYYGSSPYFINPQGPDSGSSRRVLRGGSWNYFGLYYCTVSHRNDYSPNSANSYIGFRVCR
jgi:sulfatase modifying factor 1